jgi:hypothetical protein
MVGRELNVSGQGGRCTASIMRLLIFSLSSPHAVKRTCLPSERSEGPFACGRSRLSGARRSSRFSLRPCLDKMGVPIEWLVRKLVIAQPGVGLFRVIEEVVGFLLCTPSKKTINHLDVFVKALVLTSLNRYRASSLLRCHRDRLKSFMPSYIQFGISCCSSANALLICSRRSLRVSICKPLGNASMTVATNISPQGSSGIHS